MQYNFEQNEEVLVHSLGILRLDKTYRAKVCGISVDHGNNPATIYIIEIIDPIDSDYKFSHCSMPAACLKRYVCDRT